MRMWSLPFSVGYADFNIACSKCAREYIIRRISLMKRLFGPNPTYCVYCGEKAIEVEFVDEAGTK